MSNPKQKYPSLLKSTSDLSLAKSLANTQRVSLKRRLMAKQGYCQRHPDLIATYKTKKQPTQYHCIKCGNQLIKKKVQMEFIGKSQAKTSPKITEIKQMLLMLKDQQNSILSCIEFFQNPNKYCQKQEKLVLQFYDKLIKEINQLKSLHQQRLISQKRQLIQHHKDIYSSHLKSQLDSLYKISFQIQQSMQSYLQTSKSFQQLRKFLSNHRKTFFQIQKERTSFSKVFHHISQCTISTQQHHQRIKQEIQDFIQSIFKLRSIKLPLEQIQAMRKSYEDLDKRLGENSELSSSLSQIIYGNLPYN